MLSWIGPGQTALTHSPRPVCRTRLIMWRRAALLFVVVALLVMGAALTARVRAFGAAGTPTMHDPLLTRVRYARTLVADAEYQLALKPRAIAVWRWHIEVMPAQPDPQRAWDDTRRIAPVSFDEPDVLSTLGSIQRAYQHLTQDAMLAQEAHEAYTPDYTAVQTLLDFLDADLAAALSVSHSAVGDQGVCQVCTIE